MQTIAIIPARGGSERIPKKNIRLFCGKPIISYSIDTARKSGIFDEIIVSTDDDDIAKISLECGATVPRLRPLNISDGVTGVLTVIAYELEQLQFEGFVPANVCLIYATAPLLRSEDLVSSYVLFKNRNTDFVFAAAEFSAPIFRAFTIQSDGTAKMLQPENYNKNSQDLPVAYHDAGQFCWGRREAMISPDSVVFSDRAIPFVLPVERVVDIDSIEDWNRAEWLFRAHEVLST